MKHVLPGALIVALIALVATQLCALRAVPARPATVPIVVPAAANRPPSDWYVFCDNPGVDDELRDRLRAWPVDRLLCSWQRTCQMRECPDAERARVRALVELRRRVLDLRNRKHALNVQAMETAAAILDDLTPAQRQFLFDNRDRAVWEVREGPAMAPLAGEGKP